MGKPYSPVCVEATIWACRDAVWRDGRRARMALRGPLGASSGEVMREDAIPCERITRIFATVAGIGGVFLAWPLCHIHYGQWH